VDLVVVLRLNIERSQLGRQQPMLSAELPHLRSGLNRKIDAHQRR
jgi:hypothetical protein